MASRFLQVLLSATVVAFIAVGCGNRGFNPPSDEDMIHNFYAHEDAFNEITEILLNCPYGDIYPPFYPSDFQLSESKSIASMALSLPASPGAWASTILRAMLSNRV